MVCAAGNSAQKLNDHGGERFYVDTAPAIFGKGPHGYGLPLLVVGNCNEYGERQETSQVTQYQQIYAPGVHVRCATGWGQGYRFASGTSYCTYAS